ncbi:MAG: hypothetical protein MZV63_16845 [Marinilabiliales bacterium]|nr:hypothetical protein [Marinilabiliales bacterium]
MKSANSPRRKCRCTTADGWAPRAALRENCSVVQGGRPAEPGRRGRAAAGGRCEPCAGCRRCLWTGRTCL